MATIADLVAVGIPSLKAMHLGWDSAVGLTALANATRTGALELTATVNQITTSTATNNSAVLPSMVSHPTGWFFIRNGASGPGATALTVFPFDSTEKFNEQSLGSGISIAVGRTGLFLVASSTEWLVSIL